ncbi:MAG: hypothetical protein IIZ78_10810 [Clostridiales bacterium]|nr:hypothetical protein [Clostridiales bacterium]
MENTLRKMPYAQAKVRDYADIGYDLRVLQSYKTDVIIVDKGIMECTGLYSMTTRKHISAFLWEYYPAISFNMVKAIAGTKKRIDVKTGELIG